MLHIYIYIYIYIYDISSLRVNVQIVMQSGSLKLLEPSGPVQGLLYFCLLFINAVETLALKWQLCHIDIMATHKRDICTVKL